MNVQNYDFITSELQSEVAYHVKINPTAETIDEWRQEVLEILECFLDSFSDIYLKNEAEAQFIEVNSNPSFGEVTVAGRNSNLPRHKVEVTSNDAIRGSNIVRASEDLVSGNTTVQIPYSIHLSGGRTFVYLNQGMTTIDRHSEFHKQSKQGKVIDEHANSPPIDVSFTHRDYRRSDNTGVIARSDSEPNTIADRVYNLEFTVRSTIWTGYHSPNEDVNQICQINRARFHDAFSKLRDSFEILEIAYNRVEFPEHPEHIASLFDYEGPRPDCLIDDYRHQWVQKHLRDQAIGKTEDGKRVVDFGSIDELVFPEELKARIETYVRQTDSSTDVDCIRVTTLNGRTIQGAITSDGLCWGMESR